MASWRSSRRLRPSRRLGEGYETLEPRRLLYAAVAEGEGVGEIAADFSLVDLNPTSHTYNQPISPRDYLNGASLWYFAHAT